MSLYSVYWCNLLSSLSQSFRFCAFKFPVFLAKGVVYFSPSTSSLNFSELHIGLNLIDAFPLVSCFVE